MKFDAADFEPIRCIALQFTGAEDSVSHENTPSIKVRGKLMCRLHDCGEFIPIRLTFELRDAYLESHPEIFHLPEHFRNYPYVCMWIHDYDKKLLHEVLEASWRVLASKKQIMEYEKAQKP
ncbi:MAG: hypothetical protein JNL70_08650 [Saprospiraceae bacterium]|nr:hypothetical protein [Saprospiraceae bacterium]